MNYYQILQVDRNATTKEIKKHYYKLAKQYHPDKNSGDINKCNEFKLLSEAYSTLSNPKKRYLYDLKKDYSINEEFNLNFTEQDYELLHSYYEKVMNSTEVKFIKILYKSLPVNIKAKMKQKFNDIVKKEDNHITTDLISFKDIKFIDTGGLDSRGLEDYIINLRRKFSDIYNNVLKQIIVRTKDRSYHLFITDYNYRIKIKLKYNYLILNIIGDLLHFKRNKNDLIYEQEINLYQYYYGNIFSLTLNDSDIRFKNHGSDTHKLDLLGFKDPLTGKRGDLYIVYKVDFDKHNLLGEEDKQLMDHLFN